MNKIVVLNHKMNLLYSDIYDYIDKLNNIETKEDIIVAPSDLYLIEFTNTCNWWVASQNVYYEEKGGYTGEISTLQLKDIGVEYSIAGHSDRRKYFSETVEDINLKLKSLLDSNIIPILCFGEKDEDDDVDTVISELKEMLEGIDNISFIMFAYEPTYMIGSKKEVDVDKYSHMISDIKAYLTNNYHGNVNMLYGGNVNKDNVYDIINDDNIDGVMIGELSSNIDNVIELFKNIDREVQ